MANRLPSLGAAGASIGETIGHARWIAPPARRLRAAADRRRECAPGRAARRRSGGPRTPAAHRAARPRRRGHSRRGRDGRYAADELEDPIACGDRIAGDEEQHPGSGDEQRVRHLGGPRRRGATSPRSRYPLRVPLAAAPAGPPARRSRRARRDRMPLAARPAARRRPSSDAVVRPPPRRPAAVRRPRCARVRCRPGRGRWRDRGRRPATTPAPRRRSGRRSTSSSPAVSS